MTTDSTITPELLDQLLANYEKPEDLTGADGLFKQGTVRDVVGIWSGALSGNLKLSSQAARSIG